MLAFIFHVYYCLDAAIITVVYHDDNYKHI